MPVPPAAAAGGCGSDGRSCTWRRPARATAVAAIDATLDEQLPPTARTPLRELLLTHRATWRVTVVQPDGSGAPPAVRGLAVVDAGPTGLFLRTSPAEPLLPGALTSDTVLVLSPADPGSVWSALVDLLADAGEDGEAQEVA